MSVRFRIGLPPRVQSKVWAWDHRVKSWLTTRRARQLCACRIYVVRTHFGVECKESSSMPFKHVLVGFKSHQRHQPVLYYQAWTAVRAPLSVQCEAEHTKYSTMAPSSNRYRIPTSQVGKASSRLAGATILFGVSCGRKED